MRRMIVILVMGLGMTVLPQAFAATTTQTVSGNIQVGNPGSCCFLGVNEKVGPSALDGIDGVWITLNRVSTGRETAEVVVTDTPGLSDFDVFFYRSNRTYISDASCAANVGGPESCTVPTGAAYAIVDMFIGAHGSFLFTYRY